MTANPLSTIPPIGPTTGMPLPQQGGKFKPIDPVQLIRQHLLKLIVAAIIGGLGGAIACKILQSTSPEYTSNAKFEVTSPKTLDDQTLGQQSAGDEVFIRGQIASITSDEMLRRALQDPTAQNTDWYRGYNNDIITAAEDFAKEHLVVTPVRSSALINLAVSMPNPADAQSVLKALTDQYLNKQRVELQQLSLDDVRVFTDEINRLENELRTKEREMQQFLRDRDLTTLKSSESDASIVFRALTSQMLELEGQLNAARSAYEALAEAEGTDADRPMSETEEAYLRRLPPVFQREETLRSYNEEIASLEDLGLGKDHPQMRRLLVKQGAIERELESTYQAELPKYRQMQLATQSQVIEGLSSQIAEVREAAGEARVKLSDITQRLTTYANLESEKARLQSTIAEQQNRVQEIRLLTNRAGSQRVKLAVAPTAAELTSPLLKLWVPMGIFLATGLVGGLLFVRELLDQRVKSPSDVKLLPDVPLLGLIPSTSEDPSGHRQAECVVEELPTGLMAESYRQVRTAVLSKMERRGYKTLLLVSAQPGAGTSTVVQNLAASLAYNNKSVLIIDTNFRRPRQHALADCGNGKGLVDILRGNAVPADLIVKHNELPLHVMPTGLAAESPPELLEGAAFRGFLSEMEASYDFVIIDAAPALLTSDSQLLAKHVDAIAVVVRAGTDKRGMVSRMLSRLDGQRADVLGVILNGVKTSAGGYFRKSYEAFYNYRSEEQAPIQRGSSHASAKPLRAEADTGDANDDSGELLSIGSNGNGSSNGNGKL